MGIGIETVDLNRPSPNRKIIDNQRKSQQEHSTFVLYGFVYLKPGVYVYVNGVAPGRIDAKRRLLRSVKVDA
jgi:hypothetical protein